MLILLSDDGYRLTYGGLDYLALNAHRRSNTIFSLGNQIGVGKESDIYITASPEGRQQVLKLHRLGRISFRTVKANRDYLRKSGPSGTGDWKYLSRLAAHKEYEFMRVLHREGFPIPEPLAWSRHTVVMEFIDSFPLRMVDEVGDPGTLYAELMDLIVRLAQRGLIHGDFNEFNILIKEKPRADGSVQVIPILIDFPQTVSTNHANAQYYFDRDVACVKRYFERRFKYTSDAKGPTFKEALKGADPERRLDVEVEASGFSKKMMKESERFLDGTQAEPVVDAEDEDEDEDHEAGEEDERDDLGEQEAEKEAEEAPDAQTGHPGLAQGLESLSVDDSARMKMRTMADFGLQPIELPQEPDVIAEKLHTKKKATGWAI